MAYTKNNKSTKGNKAWSPKPEVERKQKSPYNYGGDSSAYKNAPNVHIPANARKSQNTGFMNAMAKTWDDTYNFANLTYTENGAIGYKSTGNKLLDLNFAVASLRGKTDREIYAKFREAFNEYPVYAMRWLAYASDVREGLGERNLFRVCMMDMAKHGQENMIKMIVPLIPEYSRWDNLWPLLNTKAKSAVIALIKKQMKEDNANYLANKSVSLMAKWLPSENTSSKQTVKYAEAIMKGLKMSPKEYRQWLSRMRKYIDVVERKMSSDNWQAIDYEAVPSRANLIYNKAFLKHDYDRRNAYLSALTKGEAKINSSVAYPHDIVSKYGNSYHYAREDATLEGMWKALPDMVKGCGNTLVVADGSGSMGCLVGGTRTVTARNVADALAIYFAEHCSGQFKNNYITFSTNPQLVNLGNGSLLSKLKIAHQHNEVASTNIEAVFDLILNTAVKNRMSQKDMPENILIISDMEFNSCAVCNTQTRSRWGYAEYKAIDKTLFGQIANRYAQYGYKLPRLVFWNVNSRTGTIPVKENDMGVALVSGFSVNICKMVMSGKLDAFECLLEAINVPRYDAVEKAVIKAMEEQIGG